MIPHARRIAHAVALALLVSTGVRPAAAADREKERTALYKQGVALGEAGRWAEAVEKFRAVIAIRPAPPALFTLGEAEEHLGRLRDAKQAFEQALQSARAGGHREVAKAAASALAALGPRIPTVVVRVAGGPRPDAEARLDGERVSFDEPVEADPGKHLVVVRAPGAAAFEQRVVLTESQRLTVQATLAGAAGADARAEGAPPLASATPDGPSRAWIAGPVSIATLGIGAGVAGIVLRLEGQSAYDSAVAACAGGCTEDASRDGNAARTRMLVGTVMVGAGAALVAGGAIWLGAGLASKSGASAAIVPAPGGAAVVGRF